MQMAPNTPSAIDSGLIARSGLPFDDRGDVEVVEGAGREGRDELALHRRHVGGAVLKREGVDAEAGALGSDHLPGQGRGRDHVRRVLVD